METLEIRLRKRDEQRRAMLHIMGDLNESNKRLANQRKAMLHILADYEQDRRRLARQTERLDNSRRALLHILQDSHKDKLRLEASRKAMIHIMGDLRETTAEMQRREQELRDKQEQLVQAGKLATLGELTTGVAHELNNPLNNIDLFVGNAVDLIELAVTDKGRIVGQLRQAMQQVRKATEIISHLRTFGRAAPASREPMLLRQIIERALSLMQEQLRLREIEVTVDLGPEEPWVVGNAIQMEQVFINLLTNARDAMADSPRKAIRISGSVASGAAEVALRRYRARDSARARAADLRPVFHDQGCRERHGPWSVHRLRDHQGARRHDLGRERARRRRHVLSSSSRWRAPRATRPPELRATR